MGDDNNAFWGNIISNGMGLLAGGIAEVITDTMKDPVSKFMAKQLLSFTQTAPLDYQLKMRVEDKDFKQSTVEMLGSIAGSEALPLVAGFLVGGPLGFGETALYTLIGGAYGGALTERMFDSDSVMLDYVSEEVHLAGNQCFLGNVGNQWKLVTSNLDVTTYTSPATLPGPPTLLENTLVVKQKSEFENVKYTFDVNTGKLDGVDFESSRLSGYPSAMQDFLLELKKAYPDAFTDGMQIGYIDLHRTYIQIPLDHMVEYDGQVSNSTEIETVHGQNGEVIGYLIPPTSTTTINGVTVNTISLVNMVTQRAKEAGEFLAHTVTNVADAFEDAIFGANRATTLATIATRLVQGESFGSIITSMTEQLVAQTVVTSTLDAVLQDQIGGYLAQAYNAQRVTVTDGIWTVVKQSGEVVQLSGAQARQMANYDAVYKGLAMFAINGILSGDYKQAAETATIQTIVESGFTQIQAFQVYERNLLTGDVLKDPVTGNPLVAGLNPAGAAAMAAAVTLLTSLVSEGQISQQAVGQAVLAASSTLITTTLVAAYTAVTTGTAFSAAFSTAFSNVSALGGPAGIIIGAAVSYALTKLLSGSKTYHDETIGSTVEVQADGSLKVIGLREAGALLRTTGTTDDDYYGTDTSDTNTGGGNDVMVGQAGKNEMYGKGGNDLIEGRAAADYIDGGTGDDHIEAGSGDDFATGGAGNDRIYGQAGNDKLLGDVGDDTILGGDGDDEIEGNDGVDQLFGGTGKDTIAAGAGNDWVDGGTGNDVLNGEAGYDQISGGDGDDIVHGNDGNDLLSGSSGNDDVRGDNGDDIILGDDGVDQLYGGDGNDVLDGGTQNDILFGGLGADTLNGGTGDDDLYGEIGNDFLAGGIGNDLLNGGDGDDVFVYSRGEGKDTIDDTSGANKLKFMDIKATDIASIARVGDDLVLTIDAYNSVTVKNHFITAGITTIEFGDGKAINVAAMTFDTTTGIGSYSLTSGSNLLINYTAQLEKYQELNVTFGASTILSTSWLTTNYDTRVTTDAYDLELYNDVQVRMWQKKAGFFGMRVSVGYYDYFERFLNGSGYSDRIVGMFTDEVIDGAAGNDQLYGNVGNDTVVGGSEHDILFGGTGNDNMQGVGG